MRQAAASFRGAHRFDGVFSLLHKRNLAFRVDHEGHSIGDSASRGPKSC